VTALECERWQWRELIASENGPSDPSTRLVLFVLSLHMNQRGENAFPAQKLIAIRAGLSERSVRTHLNLAADAGWLRICKKAQKGQAWFVHEYVATIPDRLAELRTSKPWEDDPTWERPANPAGRRKGRKSGLRAANGAERPAILAERPANDDTTGGNLRHDARQGLPTNSSLKSSLNLRINHPRNVQQQAAAPRVPDSLDGKSSKAEDPAKPPTLRKVLKGKAEFSDLPKDQRERLALEVMAAVPTQALKWFVREYDLPIEDVERLKLSLSEAGALH
jgi:hypothetical protein